MNSSIRSWSSRARSDGGGSTVLMGPTYPLRPGSGARDLPEVPADDLVRDHLQPGVPAVRRVRVDAGVLAGEQPLRLDQLGHVGVAARDVADRRRGAGDLHAAQLAVRVAGVDDDPDARVAGEVGPALAADERGQPERAAVTGEP